MFLLTVIWVCGEGGNSGILQYSVYEGMSDFWISGQSFINENCHNSRTSYDIDMKLWPVTKLDKTNTLTSKNSTITLCQQNLTSLSFFQFMANLQLFGNGIRDTWSTKLAFLLIVTFYSNLCNSNLLKLGNRTKKCLPQLLYYCFE